MRFAADAVIYVHLWYFNCTHMITLHLLGNSVVARTCHNGDVHGQPSIATRLDSDQTPWRRIVADAAASAAQRLSSNAPPAANREPTRPGGNPDACRLERSRCGGRRMRVFPDQHLRLP